MYLYYILIGKNAFPCAHHKFTTFTLRHYHVSNQFIKLMENRYTGIQCSQQRHLKIQFCVFASFPGLLCIVATQDAYKNDHQPSLIQMVVLKVKDIASRFRKYFRIRISSSIFVKIPYSCDSTYTICSSLKQCAALEQ